jgi:hypothetical protein
MHRARTFTRRKLSKHHAVVDARRLNPGLTIDAAGLHFSL